MANKTEEKLKNIFDDRLDATIHKITERVHSIFLWGVLVGVILSYTNFLSLTAGFSVGYVIARKEIPLVEYAIMKMFFILDNSGILTIVKEKIKNNFE